MSVIAGVQSHMNLTLNTCRAMYGNGFLFEFLQHLCFSILQSVECSTATNYWPLQPTLEVFQFRLVTLLNTQNKIMRSTLTIDLEQWTFVESHPAFTRIYRGFRIIGPYIRYKDKFIDFMKLSTKIREKTTTNHHEINKNNK